MIATLTENPQRHLLFLSTPALWQTWPFLPLVRRRPEQDPDYGVLYDCWRLARRPGLSATVFLCNVFQTSPTEAEFLTLPRESFDSAEEIYAAGWRVD